MRNGVAVHGTTSHFQAERGAIGKEIENKSSAMCWALLFHSAGRSMIVLLILITALDGPQHQALETGHATAMASNTGDTAVDNMHGTTLGQ